MKWQIIASTIWLSGAACGAVFVTEILPRIIGAYRTAATRRLVARQHRAEQLLLKHKEGS
jgi:hypothetical protein